MNKKKLLVFTLLALVAAAGGVALALMFGGSKATAQTTEGTEGATGEAHAGESHGSGDAHGGGGAHGPKVNTGPYQGEGYLVFDRMIMNLHDPALIKYLTIEVVLVVDPSDEVSVFQLIAKKKPLLRDRLVTLTADKTLDDVTGKVGVNRLKREIHDEFNRILFPDGVRRIQDVLFDEWHIDG